MCERYVYIEGGELANSFEGADCPSLLVYLNDTNNLEMIQSLLGCGISLEGNILDVSTKTSPEYLHKMFKILGNYELIEKIEVKEEPPERNFYERTVIYETNFTCNFHICLEA